jgi:hypothetical protein
MKTTDLTNDRLDLIAIEREAQALRARVVAETAARLRQRVAALFGAGVKTPA